MTIYHQLLKLLNLRLLGMNAGEKHAFLFISSDTNILFTRGYGMASKYQGTKYALFARPEIDRYRFQLSYLPPPQDTYQS